MSKLKYNKNFIKKVIAKIDFQTPIEFFTPDSLADAVAEIKKRFPIVEQGMASQQSVEFTPTGAQTQKVDFQEWIFHGSDRSKYLKVNKLFIEVLLTTYSSETSFKEDLVTPIQHLLKINSQMPIRRTGVRFINIFDFPISSPQEAINYFNNKISSIYQNMDDFNFCSRSILSNEFIYDDIKLRRQSGFFNPDYPAIIKRNHFVIDIDAYIDFPHLINDVTSYFARIHGLIEKVFEESISEKLRNEVLNG